MQAGARTDRWVEHTRNKTYARDQIIRPRGRHGPLYRAQIANGYTIVVRNQFPKLLAWDFNVILFWWSKKSRDRFSGYINGIKIPASDMEKFAMIRTSVWELWISTTLDGHLGPVIIWPDKSSDKWLTSERLITIGFNELFRSAKKKRTKLNIYFLCVLV